MASRSNGDGDDGNSSTSTAYGQGQLHRSVSRGSVWSPAETPVHHNQGTSYFPANSWQHTSTTNPRSSSSTRAGMRSSSISSSHAPSRRRGNDDDILSEADEYDDNGLPFDDDTPQERPRMAHRRSGKAAAASAPPPNNEETSGDSVGEGDREGDDPITLKERQSLINVEHPFGLPIWKPALYKKSRTVTRNADAALHAVPSAQAERHLLPGNLFWAAAFGWWLGLACILISAVLYMTPFGGKKYARLVYGLGWYIFWPFGKYVEGDAPEDALDEEEEEDGEGHTWEGSDATTQSNDAHSTSTVRLGASNGPRVQVPREDSSLLHNRDTSLPPPIKSYGTTIYSPPATTYGGPSLETSSKASDWLGKICFWLAFICIIAPLLLVVCSICWALVVTIPMAKLNWQLIKFMFTRPFTIRFCAAPPVVVLNASQDQDIEASGDATPQGPYALKVPRLSEGQLAPSGSPTSTVLLCVYRAVGSQYYKYTVGGVNILFVNLMPIVFFVIFDGMVLLPWAENLHKEHKHVPALLAALTSRALIFGLCLASVIPLSYFIGMAVASISAQSSIGMGAVINATFGSIIEIILYGIALTQGKGHLVEGSIVGSLLAGVLLMPGMSMCSMAVRRKELRFNAKSAGVTSMMLIMAIIGCVAPTLFYQTYGNFQLVCSGCPSTPSTPGKAPWICDHCYYKHPDPVDDPFYQSTVKGFMFLCTVILIFSYLIGLWFSLRTHASQIWQNPQQLMHAQELAGHNSLRTSIYHRLVPNSAHSPHPAPQLHRKASNVTNTEPGSPGYSRHPSGPSYSPSFPKRVSYATTSAGQPSNLLESVDHAVKNTDLNSLQLPGAMTTDDFTRAVAVATVSALRHQQTHSNARIRASAGEQEGGGGHGGHDGPSWSRTTSASVLLACTALYAVIAELLVDVVDVILEGSGIDEKFLGVTLFALVPNTTEFMNAMSFALNGNIALSMEIGSAYALQVCLLQIPAMVAFSAWYDPEHMGEVARTFSLIFPRWDVIALILSMFLMTYTYIEAKSNYHRGSILILSYCVLLAGFYYAPPTDADMETGHLGEQLLTFHSASLTAWETVRWYLSSLIPW